jgi:hypothetical protein
MTYGCPTWEYAAKTQLLKLQCLLDRVFHITGNLDRCTSVHKPQAAFKILYVYNYVTSLWRTQAEVIVNHVNPNVHDTGQGEVMHRKYTRLKRGGSQA